MRSITSYLRPAVVGLALVGALPAHAEDDKPKRAITVSASGTVSVEPDQARITSGVTADGASAREALTANTAAMQKVIAALKEGRHRRQGYPDRVVPRRAALHAAHRGAGPEDRRLQREQRGAGARARSRQARRHPRPARHRWRQPDGAVSTSRSARPRRCSMRRASRPSPTRSVVPSFMPRRPAPRSARC